MRTPRRPDADRRLRRLRAGTQVTLVALPYQVFVLTWSSFAVGLIGLAELVPLVALSFVGGALADRMERRRLLQAVQVVQLSTSALLAVGAAAGPPPAAALYVLAGVAAAASAIDRPTRTAIVPNLVSAQELQPAISLNYGLFQLAMVVGPALGGIVIAAAGLGWAYTLDVVTFAAMLAAVARMRRQQPPRAEGESFLRAVRSGLAYAAGRGELLGSFAVDLLAMTFGMPRALFPALSLTVYHAGATGVRPALRGALVRRHRGGVLDLMAEPHAPAGPDRRRRDRRLGARRDARRPHPQPDRCDGLPRDRRRGRQHQRRRSTVRVTATPDAMRGRVSAIFTLVVTGGPRLGDVESGSVAAVFGTQAAVASGGILCIARRPIVRRSDDLRWVRNLI